MSNTGFCKACIIGFNMLTRHKVPISYAMGNMALSLNEKRPRHVAALSILLSPLSSSPVVEFKNTYVKMPS
jgi:hypothetical protein